MHNTSPDKCYLPGQALAFVSSIGLFSRPPGVSGETATLYVFAQYPLLLVGLGPKLLEDGSQPSLNGSARNLRKSLMSRPG